MHARTSCCPVSGDYGCLIDSCCAVVCLQSKSIKNIESIDTKLRLDEILQVWPFPSFNHCCHWMTRSTAKHHRFFRVYLFFYKKLKEFSRPVFRFFFFPRFQGPVRAMYQSVGKCFRMHLWAVSIHKISGGRGPCRFFEAWLAPWPIRWHFTLVRTLHHACNIFHLIAGLAKTRVILILPGPPGQ